MASKTETNDFFECGGCGAWHPYGWGGDCRNDSKRLNIVDLDLKYGLDGWREVCELCRSTIHSSADHHEHPDLGADEWTDGFDG